MTAIVRTFGRVPAASGRLRLGQAHRKAALRMLDKLMCWVQISSDSEIYRHSNARLWEALPAGSLLSSVRWEDPLSCNYVVQVRMTMARRRALRLPQWARVDKAWLC